MQFYSHRAGDYERLVKHEDYQGNLIKAIREIHPLNGARVVEFGAGTGRLTRELAPFVNRIEAFDRSRVMLAEAKIQLKANKVKNASLSIGDNRQMPAAGNWADLAVEGWSFLHLFGWYPDSWQNELDRALGEMARIVGANGDILLIETLGTGYKGPTMDTSFRPFFEYLESAYGFRRSWTRTDYRFDTRLQAKEIVGDAFGQVLDRLERGPVGWILPECTGFWYRWSGDFQGVESTSR
jgi:ubiquinone/menaquinone biosynthesis C-methylase UbiE